MKIIEIKKEIIGKLKDNGIIHPNPLTDSELKIIDFCIDYFASQFQPLTKEMPTFKMAVAKCNKDSEMYSEPEELQSKLMGRKDLQETAYANGFINCYNWILSELKQPTNEREAKFKELYEAYKELACIYKEQSIYGGEYSESELHQQISELEKELNLK